MMRILPDRMNGCLLCLGRILPGMLGGFFECAAEYGFRYAFCRTTEKISAVFHRVRIRHFQKAGRKPLVSFILSVGQDEQHLDRCLQALMEQTLQQMEIIAVGDDGTDILKQYATKDCRIRAFSQSVQTAGDAWNLGLSHAAGEYVIFLDASCIPSQNLALEAYIAAKAKQTDILLLGSQTDPNALRHPSRFAVPERQPFSHKDCAGYLFQITDPSLHTKLFCRAFILQSGLQVHPFCQGQDVSFTYAALAMARRIAALDEIPVCYESCAACRPAQTPDFLQPYLTLHDKLADLGLLEQLRKSYVNAVLTHCIHDVNSILDASQRSRVCEILRSSGFSQLEIPGYDRTYYYDQEKYLQMLRILHPEKTADTSLSVLIPVYNVEKYLEDCLDSVTQCKDPNLEIICTNDCSTDGSLEILRRYAQKDSRIKIIDKKQNEGLLHARKSGVEAASNSHIVFLDSDDFVTEGIFEFIQNALLFEPADIIHFSSGVEDHTGDVRNIAWLSKALRASNVRFYGEDVLKEGYIHRSYVTSMFGKVFKTELCKKAYALLPDKRCYVGEDILTHFFLSYFAESFTGFDTRDFCIYRYGLGVSNNTTMSVTKFENYCQMALWARHIQDTLLTDTASDVQVQSCNAAAFRMFEDCVRAFQTQIAEADQDAAFQILCTYWRDFPFTSQYLQETLGLPLAES